MKSASIPDDVQKYAGLSDADKGVVTLDTAPPKQDIVVKGDFNRSSGEAIASIGSVGKKGIDALKKSLGLQRPEYIKTPQTFLEAFTPEAVDWWTYETTKMGAQMLPLLKFFQSAPVIASFIGGLQESQDTFDKAIKRGDDIDAAAVKSLEMALASGALNATSFSMMLKKLPPSVSGKFFKMLGTGFTEYSTELAEEPTESAILGKNINEIASDTKQAMIPLLPAAVVGFAGGLGGETSPSPSSKQTQTYQKNKQEGDRAAQQIDEAVEGQEIPAQAGQGKEIFGQEGARQGEIEKTAHKGKIVGYNAKDGLPIIDLTQKPAIKTDLGAEAKPIQGVKQVETSQEVKQYAPQDREGVSGSEQDRTGIVQTEPVQEAGAPEVETGRGIQTQEGVGRQIVELAKSEFTPYQVKTVDIGIVSLERAVKIKRLSNEDVDGYVHQVDNYGLRHALNEHSKDPLPLRVEDFALIPEIIETGKISYEGKTQKGKGLPAIKYEKKINGGIYYVEEIRTGNKTLSLKTMYKKSEGASHAPSGLEAIRPSFDKTSTPSGNVSTLSPSPEHVKDDVDLAVGEGIKRQIEDLYDYTIGRVSNEKRLVKYGTVNKDEAARIKGAADNLIDVEGYKRVIDNYAIRHILNEHGNPKLEEKRGQIAITKNDIALIPEITATADKIVYAGKTNVGRDAIRYVKKVNGSIYVIDEIRTGKRELMPVSMYKKKATMPDAPPFQESPAQTPEASRGFKKKVATNDMPPFLETPSHTSETLRNLSDNTIPSSEKPVKSDIDPDVSLDEAEEKPHMAVDMPELVELARKLAGGKYPRIKEKLRAYHGMALGQFSEGGKKKGTITLKADNFKDPKLTSVVLAHEIGHFVDYLPDETLKRGNILGRVASFKKYLKYMLEEMPDSPYSIITPEERNSIRNVITKEVLRENGKGFKDFMDDKVLRDELRPEIAKRVKELIAEIKDERGLFTRQEITDELKAITQEWRPFNEGADAKYTRYRHSSKELYADALSVLLSNPAMLEEKAPRFTKAFFNWMRKKPDVQSLYNEIQDRISNEQAVTERRTENVRKMFGRGEKQRLEQIDRKKPLDVMGYVRKVIVDKNARLIRRIERLKKQGKVIAPEDNPLYWIEELPYVSGEVYNYLHEVDNIIKTPAGKEGITVDDIGEYQFFRRVATERADIANPLGHYKETAEKQLADLKARLGEDRYNKLEGYVKRYWELRQKNIFTLLENAGMYSPELMQKILNNENYSTFDIIKSLEGRYGRGVSSHIYKQVGTLHEVRNPFIATVMKDAVLIRAANANMAKEKAINFLKENFSDEITAADTRWNGKYQEPVLEPPKPDEQGAITILKNGKIEAYYAPKEIADNFKHDPYEANIILRAWQELNKPLRAILVSKNPLWMLGNSIRDAIAVYKQVPGMTAAKLVKYYSKALGDAYNDVFRGKETETVSKMLKGKMLVLDRHFATVDMPAETELDRMLQSYGQSPVRYRNMVIKPFVRLLDFLGKLGKFTERVPKIAGYKYLTETKPKMSEKQVAHIVRTRAGTPDPYRRGAWHSVTNSIFMFSNIGKEGWRSSWEAYKENKADYMWKTVAINIMPKLVLLVAAHGLLGDDEKEIVKGVSDYDKENYTIIPLGMTGKGKSVYLRIPQDFTGQIIGGVVWNIFTGQITGKGGLFAYGQEQQPYGLNPYLSVAVDWIQYLSSRNPYDAFYGRYIIPEREFKAGGIRTAKRMVEHTWNELGGSVFHRFKGDNVGTVKSELEKMLEYSPGNILGKFLKISDYGVREELRKITEKAGAKEAGRQLEVRDRIIEVVDEASDKGRKPIVFDMVKLYRELAKDNLIDPANTSVRQFRAMFNRYASRSDANPYIDAVINAGSNEEKAALLKEFKKTLGEEKAKEIERQLRKEGHLGKGAVRRAVMRDFEDDNG